MARVIIREGGSIGQEFELPAGKRRVVIGRRKANEIPIADPKASRDHAEIIIEDNRFVIRDLKSSNKTYVNEVELVTSTTLHNGDLIRIGDTIYEFLSDASTEKVQLSLPGYKMLEQIGRGGMGNVYKARQVSMDRLVAIKILHSERAQDKRFIKRFLSEARAAGRLSHPNIIQVHNVSEHEGTHFFSMELIEGLTGRDLLRKNGRVPVVKCIKLAIQLASALDYAHGQQVIHRDIKPENLIITSEDTLKLADLGIAKLFSGGDKDTAPEEKKTRKVLGTPHYMAPEQAMGHEVDVRADIYSMGATLYHMLSGTPPYEGDSIAGVLKAHVRGDLQPLRERCPDIPAPVSDLVSRMMHKNADKRIPSAEVLHSELTALLEKLEGSEDVSPSAEIAAPIPITNIETHTRNNSKAMRALRISAAVGGLIALLFITIYVTQLLIEDKTEDDSTEQVSTDDNPDSNENTEPQLPAGPSAAELQLIENIKNAQALVADKKFASAKRRAQSLLRNAAITPELKKEIEGILASADAGQQKEREERAQNLLLDARKIEKNENVDLEQLRSIYEELLADYSDIEASSVAKSRIDEITQEIATIKRKKLLKAYNKTMNDAHEHAVKGDCDAAVQIYSEFIAIYGDTVEGERVASEKKNLLTRCERELKNAVSEAEKAIEQGRYRKVDTTFELLLKKYRTKENVAKAAELKAKSDAAAEASFNKAYKIAVKDCYEFKHSRSQTNLKVLAARFSGTKWENTIKNRIDELEIEIAFFEKLLSQINAKKKVLPFIPKGSKAEKLEWNITSANAKMIYLSLRSDSSIGRSLLWPNLDSNEFKLIANTYFEAPTNNERRAIELIATEREHSQSN